MIVRFSLATLAVRLFAFFVRRNHRLRLVGQVALLRLVPKLHNHADDADADADDDGVTLPRYHLRFLRYWFNFDMVLIMTSGMMMLMPMMPMNMMQMNMVQTNMVLISMR